MTLARNVLLAAALAIVLGGLLVAPEPPSLLRIALAVGVMATAYLLRQGFRFGSSVIYIAWGEAAVIIGLSLIPAGWLPLAVLAGYLTSLVIRWPRGLAPPLAGVRRSGVGLTVAAGAAALVSWAVADPYRASLTPEVTAGLVLGALVYLAVGTAAVPVLRLLESGGPVRSQLARSLRYKLPMALGSIAIGLTAVAASHADLRWLLVLPVVLWLLNRTYAYRVRTSERRRMWSALASATRSLNQRDEAAVAAAGLLGALEVFAVGRAELELGNENGHWRAWVADQAGDVRRITGSEAETPWTVVPLLVGEGEIGRLRLDFPAEAGLGNGEPAAMQAYADALAAALHDTATHQELHRLLEQSAHDAQHDPLTGLLNRASLLARGETALQLLPQAAPVALLLVDVDHFREINDTLGHAAGDEVLAVSGQRLLAASRAGELLGRLGGDEFGLLVTEPPAGSGSLQRRLLRRARELVDLLAEEATISGVPVSIEASAGVVVVPAGTADMTELFRRADAALHQAKRGGGTVSWYEAAADAGSSDRPALLAELRSALEREDELVLALQPAVDLTTGDPTSVEALVRWQHPRRGLLPPHEFVRAVENSDLLGTFTEYVIDKALAAAARWAKRGPGVPVAVNLSARSLLDPRLPHAVAALLRKHHVPGRRLVLEITETVVTSDLPGIGEALNSLRALGVRLAVDDFGTGYASLTFLTRVPLDEVKVDGSFVNRLGESTEAAAIVRTTVELGRELGMRVVAEGVETAAQREMLTSLGCTIGQGFHLAVPTSADRIGGVLDRLAGAATRGEVIPFAGAGEA